MILLRESVPSIFLAKSLSMLAIAVNSQCLAIDHDRKRNKQCMLRSEYIAR